MADEESESALSVLTRTINLQLQPQGGRVFAHHATSENQNRQTIELKCEHVDYGLCGNTIVIGSEAHPVPNVFEDENEGEESSAEEEIGWRINTIPIMVSIYEVDANWLRESGEGRGGEALAGQFSYNPRINTADGVVNDEWPSCLVRIGIGGDTFRLIRDRLLDFKKYDFSICVDVLFPREGVKNGWMGRTVQWDGNGQLDITSSVVVWAKEDWSSGFRRKKRIGSAPEPEYVAPQEHVELMQAAQRIEASLKAVMTPLWIIAGLMLVWEILHR